MRLVLHAFVVFAVAALAACASLQFMNSDPLAWLEEVEGDRALDWVRTENARSLAILEADPRYPDLLAKAKAIVNERERLALGAVRGGYVYNFWQDEAHVRGLWRRATLESYRTPSPDWDILLDIDALAASEGANWVFKGANCLPPEGLRCLIGLSDGGKDATTWGEFDVDARAFVEGGFLVPEAKSSIAWADADQLLVATDWGPGTLTASGYPFIVKSWSRGAPLTAAAEVFRGAPDDVGAFPARVDGEDGQVLLAVVRAETFFSSTYHRIGPKGVARLPMPKRASLQALHKGELVFTIEEDWTPPGAGQTFESGTLLSYTLDQAGEGDVPPPIKTIYGPQARESIEGVSQTRDALLVSMYRNVRGQLLRMTFDGRAWVESQTPLPPNGSVSVAGASPFSSAAFAVFENYLRPSTLYEIDAARGSARALRALPAQFESEGLVSEQFEATSKDGTKIPYFVLRPRDMAMDGSAPTLLYAYGGFQVSQTPVYSAMAGKLWVERGGVYVVANIRGGGEFGPDWHQAGLKTNRQVIYDDFAAVAEDLIARKVTSPRRLGIMGGSNGGLLMGVALNQRPELYRAAVIQVPLLDMLRYDQLLAGASWVDEYGSPAVPEERAFLEKISPLHNLRPDENFPTVFIVTSTKDDRVHPAHARKYGAKLKAAGHPFFYYENIDGGHSAAANLQETARRRALEFTYLSQRLMD